MIPQSTSEHIRAHQSTRSTEVPSCTIETLSIQFKHLLHKQTMLLVFKTIYSNVMKYIGRREKHETYLEEETSLCIQLR